MRIGTCCRVPQSVESMGAAQIEIEAKNFLYWFLEQIIFNESCLKPNKYEWLMTKFVFCPLKKISEGGQNGPFGPVCLEPIWL